MQSDHYDHSIYRATPKQYKYPTRYAYYCNGLRYPNHAGIGSDILSMPDLVLADSIAQCKERGEIFHGLTSGSITKDEIVELGSILNGSQAGRSSPDQITVADLTGVAVQDIQIAAAVHKAYKEKNK